MKPRKHCEVIKAWADGAKIESRWSDGVWRDSVDPSWSETHEYRIKPERKRYRVALFSYGPCTAASQEVANAYEFNSTGFIRWLTDWVEYD